MTILQWLQKAGLAVPTLEAFIDKAAAAAPDLAPEAAVLKTALEAAISPENLAALGAAIPGELLAIAQGHITHTPHAGDSA